MENIKDFKIPMDQVKCEKYKVYQPEQRNKKFPLPEIEISLHNIKVLKDDTRDQNKATSFEDLKPANLDVIEDVPDHIDNTEEIRKDIIDNTEEIRKAITGMFRDNIRRIDIVLVVKGDFGTLINKIQLDFLIYIVRVGLEVEIEPGILEKHKNITFIKIHAPQTVVEKYGKNFGTKRHFVDTRYDYMDPIGKNRSKNHEKEWVRFVRNNYNIPNSYSNYERSIIVYKILLHLPFGDHKNRYGIERLLNNNIIADIFALHDGPYFLTPDQTISGSNARQVLNYYWCRIQNIYKKQPIHLIHEYFGPSVAFYFTFYEFFNKAMKLAALIGVLNIICGIKNLLSWEKTIKEAICTSTRIICKSCETAKICPPRKCNEYCLSAKIHLLLDHTLVPFFSIFLVIGAFVFLKLWKRREYFLKWMWEVGGNNSYYKRAVRPLFNIGFGTGTDPFLSGIKHPTTIIPIICRNFASKVIVILYWYYIVPVMKNTYDMYVKFCIKMKRDGTRYEQQTDYIIISIFYTFYILCLSVLEKMYDCFVFLIVKYENHTTYKKYWESMRLKKFGFKMVKDYSFIAYYAWIHGRYERFHYIRLRYHFPIKILKYLVDYLYGYSITHDFCVPSVFCFPYSCIIEVATLLTTLLFVTQIIYKIFQYIFSLKRDDTQSKYASSDIPCWESEFMLCSVTDEDMLQKYLNLASQFTMVIWFNIAFPLAPIIIYLINIWNIRYEARKLLRSTRRPLLFKTSGKGWSKVFYFIAFVSVLTNAITLALLTRTGTRYLMTKYDKKQKDLFDYLNFYFKDLKCTAPDMIVPRNSFTGAYYSLWTTASYFLSVDYVMLCVYRYYFIIVFVFAIGCVLIFLDYFFPNQQRVEMARESEERIKRLYYHYEYKYVE